MKGSKGTLTTETRECAEAAIEVLKRIPNKTMKAKAILMAMEEADFVSRETVLFGVINPSHMLTVAMRLSSEDKSYEGKVVRVSHGKYMFHKEDASPEQLVLSPYVIDQLSASRLLVMEAREKLEEACRLFEEIVSTVSG